MIDMLRTINPILLMLLGFFTSILIAIFIADYYISDLIVQVQELAEWCEIGLYGEGTHDR